MDGVLNGEMGDWCELIQSKRKEKNKRRAREYNRNRNRRPDVRKRNNENKFKARYGITEEQRNRMYAEQAGKCFLCGKHKHLGGRGGLYVDHNHKTGKVRRLLCAACNNKMAAIDDDEFLKKALIYKAQFD